MILTFRKKLRPLKITRARGFSDTHCRYFVQGHLKSDRYGQAVGHSPVLGSRLATLLLRVGMDELPANSPFQAVLAEQVNRGRLRPLDICQNILVELRFVHEAGLEEREAERLTGMALALCSSLPVAESIEPDLALLRLLVDIVRLAWKIPIQKKKLMSILAVIKLISKKVKILTRQQISDSQRGILL
jgi:hypothetical protein